MITFSSDWLFPPQQGRHIVDALLADGKRVSYCEVNSRYGHDAFLLEPEVLSRLIGGFLAGAIGRPVIGNGADVQPYQQTPAIASAWTGRRADHDRIADIIEPGSSVLDLGCGKGGLLSRLIRHKNIRAIGVEVEQDNICECIDRGISVVDLDIEAELSSFADDSYDYVVLSQTIQAVRRPEVVLREMVRIGRRCIVSFPNFAYWKAMLQMILTGQTPVTEGLPFRWYNTPNLHYLTIRDFQAYCRRNHIRILKCIPLAERYRNPVRFCAGLRAEEVIFVLGRHA